MKKKR
jgi:hypothetical protein